MSEITTIKRVPKQSFSNKILLLTLALITCFGMLAACEGPAGPEGAQGPEGPEGPIGPAGEDGSEIHAGSGGPASDVGAVGDYYLNQDTGELYGPKNDSGWGTPIDLAGEDGADGEDGSQIYSGSSAPDASLGSEGDYYLHTTTFDLYGPKTDSGWGTPINLKGTANVMYSSWTEFGSDTTWSSVTNEYGIDYRKYWVNAPQVDSTIMNEGAVLVYIDFVADHGIQPPPLVENMSSASGLEKLDYDYSFQEVELEISNYPDGTGDPDMFTSSNYYRYIIIPGGTALKGKQPDYKSMPYEELKRRFGIRD